MRRLKIGRKISAGFPFYFSFQFSFIATLSQWYQDWVKVVKVLKHAEMQSETPDVQSFGAKSGARVNVLNVHFISI